MQELTVLQIHAVGKEKHRTVVIHQEQVTADVIEQYALGMQQMHLVQLLLTMEQKQEIGDYLLKMKWQNGKLICLQLTQIKVITV